MKAKIVTQKSKTFVYIFRHSLIPLDNFYRRVRKNIPLSKSLMYFAGLLFATTSITLILLFGLFASKYPQTTIETFSQAVLDQYPDDAIILINNNGRLTTNMDRPLIIFNPLKDMYSAFIVVDSQARKSDFPSYDTRLLFTSKEVVAAWGTQVYTFKYTQNDPIRINRQTVEIFMNQIMKIHSDYSFWIVIFFVLTTILLPLLFIPVKLIYTFVLSVFTYLIAMFFIKKITLKDTFQIALHAMTAPVIFELILIATPLYLDSFFVAIIIPFAFIGAGVYESYVAKGRTAR